MTRYEASQRMRAKERKIRAMRSEEKALRAAGDTSGAAAVKRDIRSRTAEYKKFCSDVGLEERMDKTYDLGFIPKKRVDFSGESGIIEAEIEKGSIKLAINHEKQARHIKGAPEYTEGRSYLTISEDEAQEIINNKHGTGKIIKNKDGKPAKEKIECGKLIGVDIDATTKEETFTNKATIHYSKTGAHLVPRKETVDNERT